MPAIGFAETAIARTSGWSYLQRYAAATGLVALAAVLRAVFDPVLSSYSYLLFVCAVALSGLFLDHASSLWATVLSAAVLAFVFTEPRLSLLMSREDAGALVIFVGVCLLIGFAAESLRKLAERLHQERAEKEMLYRELHHRIANNLQIIGATIAMQASRSGSPETRESLRAVRDRITGIARVDRLLTVHAVAEPIDACGYLRQLCESIGASLIAVGPVSLSCEADSVRVSRDVAETLGIAVNELVTNAVKHAFGDGAPGNIAVTLGRSADGLRLAVEDDGKGCPQDVRRGTGWKLVASLIGKHKGSMTTEDAAPGCRVVITIPSKNVAA